MEKTSGDDEPITGSPSNDGKMVIKLKIPKLSSAAMEEGDQKPKTAKEGETMNQGRRVCPECKKEFSSGKALGGHMRVHANRNTFLKPSKTCKFKKSSPHGDDVINGDLRNLNEEQHRKPCFMIDDEAKPTCYTCGKIFPSMKSLFGHMRCHPDRQWRGVQPPLDPAADAAAVKLGRYKSNSSSSLSEIGSSGNEEVSAVVDDGGDEVVDLTKFLPGWSVTERRGRPAMNEAEDDEDFREAAENLISLANSEPSTAESVVTQRQLRSDAFEGCSNSNSMNKIDENLPSIDLRLINYGNDNGKGKAVMEEEIEINPPEKMELLGGSGTVKSFSDNESDGRNTNELFSINYKHKNISSPNTLKKRKKMKLMMDLQDHAAIFSGVPAPPPPLVLSIAPPPPQAASTESKYKCTACNKCFATHQALGGHRSSHNKLSKITPTDHRQNEEHDYISFIINHPGQHLPEHVVFSGDIIQTTGIANSNSSVHQCKICDKIFPTGQALGGHTRCHREAARAPSTQVTSTTGETASQTASDRKVEHDFDLNKVPPPTMVEENEAETGNELYASSSSYNYNIGN